MRTIKIKDIGDVITGHTPPTSNREYYGDYALFIKPTDISVTSKYTYETEEGYSELAYQKYKNSLVPKGSTCVVCIGTLGEKMTMAHCDCFTNQSINSIVPNESFDKQYIYYLLKNDLYKVKIMNKGTASGREFVSKSTFLDMEVVIHEDFNIQRKIGQILCAYDDLIENNQKQIKLLEEATHRLYKEWFIDLHFPGYEDAIISEGVPGGWRTISLGEAISFEIGGGWGEESVTGKNEYEAYVIRGTDIDGLKNGSFLSIPLRFHTESNLSSRKLQHGDIVFEVSGGSRTEGVARTVRITQSMLNRWDKPVMCASFCKLVRPLNDELAQYLFDHLRYLRAEKITEEYDKRSASSIVNYRWKDFLAQRTVLYPKSEILAKYNKITVPIYERIVSLSMQIETAKTARDRLLSKLMSGEIELKDCKNTEC